METENKIEVGKGMSNGFNGDCYPYTIVKIISPKKIVVQADSYRVIEKEAQFKEGRLECEFTPNPNGALITLTQRKNRRWVEVGTGMNSGWRWSCGRAYAQNPHF